MRARPLQIRHYRFLAGLSQRELAQRAGIATGTVNKIERGLSDGIPRSLRRIADALGVTIEDIAEMGGIESTVRSVDGEVASCG